MKKMMMAAVILCVIGLIIIGSSDDSGTAPANQRESQAIANRSDQDPALVIQKQDQEGNIYESNKTQLKKFVEAVPILGRNPKTCDRYFKVWQRMM